MLQDDFLRFTYSPVMKIILVFSFIGCFSSFSKVNSLPDFLDSVTLSNNLFFFISYTCYYLGVYALDVFGKGNYFFNKIIKKNLNIKKYYTEIEMDIWNCVIDGCWDSTRARVS
jgi:hypothetical protein